jgi:hypothetical protein
MLDTCYVGTYVAFIGRFSWMIQIFLMYLSGAGLILLVFLEIPRTSMTSYVLQPVWKESLLFSYDNSYTHFVQCVEYKNDEQSRLLISVIQNLVSQKQPL